MLLALRRHLLPLVALAVTVVVVTWPVAAGLGAEVPGHPQSDTYDHLQGAWWFAQEVHGGRLPLRTEVSHWPPGGALWYVDPLGGLACAVLAPFVGIAAAYGLTCLLAVWSSMAAMYAVVRHETGDPAAGLLAGVIFGGSPYVLSLLHSGTVEYLHLAPLPLAWAAFRRVHARGHATDVLVAAVVWTWATLGSFYHAAFVALLLPLSAWDADGGSRTAVLRTLLVGAAWGLLSGPFLWIAAETLRAFDAVVAASNAPGWSYARLPANDLTTFLRPGDYVFPDNRRVGNLGIRHVNYLGWIALLLAVKGAARERRLRVPLVAALILALGPVLWLDGRPVALGGTTIPLPTALLYAPGSPFRMVHHPYRLVALPMMMIAFAAARAVQGQPRLAVALAVGVLVETLLASPTVWPIPTARATAPAPVTALAEADDVRGVYTFPPGNALLNRRWSMEQTLHEKRVPYGVNVFLPDVFADNGLSRALMRCLRDPARATIGRDGGPPLPRFYAPATPEQIADGRAGLREAGYDVVVLHTDVVTDAEAACARALLQDGGLRASGADVEVWNIGGSGVVETQP